MRYAMTAGLCLTLLAGCGENKVEVCGKVRYNGEVMTSGSVTFYRKGSPPESSAISKSGEYSVTTVPGEAVIVVKGHPAQPTGLTHPGLVRPPVKDDVKIPARYGDAKTSPLKYAVKGGGKQKHDIDVEP